MWRMPWGSFVLLFSPPKSLPSRLWRMTHVTNATSATCATTTNATLNAYNATISTVIYSAMRYGKDAAVFPWPLTIDDGFQSSPRKQFLRE